MSEAVEWRARPLKLWLLFAMCIGFVMLSGWVVLLGWGSMPEDIVIVVCGAIGIALFGIFGMMILRRALSGAPALVLTPDMLAFGDPTRTSTIRVPLIEVEGMSVFEILGNTMLGFHIADEDVVISSMNRAMRLVSKANTGLGIPALSLARSAVSTPLEEIAETVLLYRERLP